MEEFQTIGLKLTNAIGDFVIASAIPPALAKAGYKTAAVSKKFLLPLWDGITNAQAFENENQLPSGTKVADISDFLSGMPYSRKIPANYVAEDRTGHLCEWMGYSIFIKSGIYALPRKEDVQVILTAEEVQFGKQKVYEISKANNNKPTVVIAPYASTKNKSLSKETLEELIKGISGFAIPCLL